MKKVLIVTTVADTFSLILRGQPGFLSSFFDVEVASNPSDGAVIFSKQESVVFHGVPMRRGISPFYDLFSILFMIRVLMRSKPDVVHSYTPKAGLVAMLAGLICGVPIRIHTFTGLIFPTQQGLRRRLLIMADRLICACATVVIPEGNGVKRDLLAHGITKKSLSVIGHGNIAGVDLCHFSRAATDVVVTPSDLRKSLLIPDDAFVFCFVGRLNKDKGISELLGAIQLLPTRAHLLLVGGLDEAAPIDSASLKFIDSHPRVHALGFQSDIRTALLLSDVFVLPSYREGFPNSVLQAGAMGLPVIATDINGCNEIIEPGVNGWLVPARKVGPLAEAMKSAMLLSKQELMRMGADARQIVERRFEQRRHWARMVKFYQDCLVSVK